MKYMLVRKITETKEAVQIETAKYCVKTWLPKSVVKPQQCHVFGMDTLIEVPEWLYQKSAVLRELQHPFYVSDCYPFGETISNLAA
jgi:hypothetical protein